MASALGLAVGRWLSWHSPQCWARTSWAAWRVASRGSAAATTGVLSSEATAAAAGDGAASVGGAVTTAEAFGATGARGSAARCDSSHAHAHDIDSNASRGGRLGE